MELSRYLDLYLAESQEHLRELGRSLLELEAGAGAEAVSRAFRAAHTIKGMSATMGYRAVAELAHALEDRLAEIRDGKLACEASVIDQLLASADLLENALASVVVAEREKPEALPDAPPPEAPAELVPEPLQPLPKAQAAPIQPAAIPPDTALVVQVTVSAQSALPAARALIARRKIEDVATVLGADPETPDASFRGERRLYLAVGADVAAVEAAARSAGEIENVVVAAPRVEGGTFTLPTPAAGRTPGVHAEAPRSRHVRVDLRRLDDLADGIGEMAVVGMRMDELAAAGNLEALKEHLGRASKLIESMRETALAMRMVPVGDVFDRFPRLVRDAARALGKQVDFRVEGRDIQVDRTVIDAMADPLVHLLRNAVDHGIEDPEARVVAGKPPRGRIVLRAFRERASVRILVEDDGGGIDASRVAAKARKLGLLGEDDLAPTSGDALLKLLTRPGFSTASVVTEVSGRGVGLDVVAAGVRALGGAFELKTERGKGSTFSLRLPISLAVAAVLRVEVGGEHYAVPMTHVREAVELQDLPRAQVRGQEVIRLRGEAIPLLRLSEVFQLPGPRRQETAAVIAEIGERRAALAVDHLVAREQIVVKSFDAAAGMLPFFSGVMLLADGRPALVLDPMTVF